MENDKSKKGSPINDSHNDYNYGATGEGLNSEQIERFEVGEDRFDQEKGLVNEEIVSRSDMDPSINDKGNISVQRSSLTEAEKLYDDKKAQDVKGGGDIGEGRAQGSDRA